MIFVVGIVQALATTTEEASNSSSSQDTLTSPSSSDQTQNEFVKLKNDMIHFKMSEGLFLIFTYALLFYIVAKLV